MAPLSLAERSLHLDSGLCILWARESSELEAAPPRPITASLPQAQIWVLYGMFLRVILYIVTYHAILPSERVKRDFKRLWQSS